MNIPASLMSVCLGVLLLFVGRRLFWLLLALLGFAAGWYLAGLWLGNATFDMSRFVIASICGVAGAVAALAIQKVGLFVAGFLGGGLALTGALQSLGNPLPVPEWMFFLAGGVLGAFILWKVFSAALVILTSVAGAALISNELLSDQIPRTALVAVLSVIGIIVQTRKSRRDGEKREQE